MKKVATHFLMASAFLMANAPIFATDAFARSCKGVAHYMGNSYSYDFPQYQGGTTECYNAVDVLVGMPKTVNNTPPVVVTDVGVTSATKAR